MKHGPREICCEPRCKNRRRKDRRRCHKCESRRKRAANPLWAAWRALKDHAAARGIAFRLKFIHWRPIAIQSDYVNRTGLNGHCLTVDRIDNTKGYFWSKDERRNNIQFLTRAKNSEKKARQDEIRIRAGYAWKERYK